MGYYRELAHYKPGLSIDDPHGDDNITLASPSVIANWENPGRFGLYARFTHEGEIYEYPLRDVSRRLISATKGNAKGKGKGKHHSVTTNKKRKREANFDIMDDDSDDDECTINISSDEEDQDDGSEEDYHMSDGE